jgi:SPW repeat
MPTSWHGRKAANWIIALLGVWEAGDVLAYLTPGFGTVPPAVANHIVVGVILMLVGAAAALTRNAGAARRMSLIAAGAGSWLILASFLLRSGQTATALANDVIVGGAVVVLGVWAGCVDRT